MSKTLIEDNAILKAWDELIVINQNLPCYSLVDFWLCLCVCNMRHLQSNRFLFSELPVLRMPLWLP